MERQVVGLHRDDVGPHHQVGDGYRDARHGRAGVTHADKCGGTGYRDGMAVDPDHGVVISPHADVRGGHRASPDDGGGRPRGGGCIGGCGGCVGLGGRIGRRGRGRGVGVGSRKGAGECIGRAGCPSGAAGRKLDAGGSKWVRGANRGGSHKRTGGYGPYRDRVAPRVGDDKVIGASAHVVVSGLESPVLGVPRVGRDQGQTGVGATVVADLNRDDRKQGIQELDRGIEGVTSTFKLIGDIPRGIVLCQKAQWALGVVPGDVDLADRSGGQCAEGLGREVKLVNIARRGTLVNHHDRDRIAVGGVLDGDTSSATPSVVVIGPIEGDVIIGVVSPGLKSAITRTGGRVQARVPGPDARKDGRGIGRTIF